MDDTKKMLRAIINGQSALKSELVGRIDKLEKKVDKGFVEVHEKIDDVEKRLTTRIDKLGCQLAYLEDDAPTREEHETLAKRVTKVEQKIVST